MRDHRGLEPHRPELEEVVQAHRGLEPCSPELEEQCSPSQERCQRLAWHGTQVTPMQSVLFMQRHICPSLLHFSTHIFKCCGGAIQGLLREGLHIETPLPTLYTDQKVRSLHRSEGVRSLPGLRD